MKVLRLIQKNKSYMKAVMIIYNIAHTEKLEFALEKLGVKGYTQWDNVQRIRNIHRGSSPWNSHLA